MEPLREAAVRWMLRWLRGVDRPVTEPGDLEVLSLEEIRCTPNGQVMLLEGAKSIYDVNREIAGHLAEKRKALWADQSPEELRAEIREIAGIRPFAEIPQPQVETIGSPIRRKGYVIEKLVIRPEKGIVLPALKFVPDKPRGDAVLYFHERGEAAC